MCILCKPSSCIAADVSAFVFYSYFSFYFIQLFVISHFFLEFLGFVKLLGRLVLCLLFPTPLGVKKLVY